MLTTVKNGSMPQRVDLVVRWNGEDYPFAFQVAKQERPRRLWDLTPSAAAAATLAPSTTDKGSTIAS